jgi:hypothetical protein
MVLSGCSHGLFPSLSKSVIRVYVLQMCVSLTSER